MTEPIPTPDPATTDSATPEIQPPPPVHPPMDELDRSILEMHRSAGERLRDNPTLQVPY